YPYIRPRYVYSSRYSLSVQIYTAYLTCCQIIYCKLSSRMVPKIILLPTAILLVYSLPVVAIPVLRRYSVCVATFTLSS
ncbi:MAG: hypothetical protein ACM3SM_03395, partial [Bacteroidota bacterium]